MFPKAKFLPRENIFTPRTNVRFGSKADMHRTAGSTFGEADSSHRRLENTVSKHLQASVPFPGLLLPIALVDAARAFLSLERRGLIVTSPLSY